MSTATLSKAYDPKLVEQSVYTFWEQHQLFQPESIPANAAGNLSESAFTIVIPPPNVTGTLHMGHALDCTIQDILIRWHRMCGDNTLWMPGTDHAGIATQNVVEKQLRAEGKSKDELGREAFLKIVWQWAQARKGDIVNQFKRLGISPDWQRQRFTLDEGLSTAVREAFVRLYDKGLIYQGRYIVNWCPRCTSAISDIETDYQDEESFLWEIAYPLSSGNGRLVVATTRPETMYGDVAVAVHPEDPRYQNLIGQTVRLPLSNRDIPIIADDYVEREFGTGALKITPAHDPNDFLLGQKHKLEPVWVLDENAHLKSEDTVPQILQGLERFEARQKTEELLREAGFLVSKKEHPHRVGHCQRCNTTIEPLLSKQWFVKTKPLAERALASLQAGELRFIPERWTNDYLRWMTDIQDWCISRQLWWGHTIPAWYCLQCEHLHVATSAPSVCQQCQSHDFRAETDVLDTWFSSGLWPFSTMGWPHLDAPDFKTYYPTSVLVTGFDIIFFWVARMVMFGLELTDQSPFHTVYIHGLIRDEKGQKMSKSKGNTVDPVEMIDAYGCDGFRFALTSLITYGGQDIKLAKDKIETGKLFCNKLWNASRFVLMNIEEVDNQPVNLSECSLSEFSLMDRWILSRYHETVQSVNELLSAYKFGEMAGVIYEFSWNYVCDWYVEYAKKQLKDPVLAANTRRILALLLDGMLKLAHPMMPYITEEIWQKLPKHLPYCDSLSIMHAPFPTADRAQIDQPLNETVDIILESIRAVRHIRQQYQIAFNTPIKLVIEAAHPPDFEAFSQGEEVLRHFITVADLTLSENPIETPVNSAAAVVSQSRVFILLEGLIDTSQEKNRMEKKRTELLKEKMQLDSMLSNEGFTARAPEAVVAKNKARLDELIQQLQLLESQLAQL